jgi:eukaryotic-like serine/threonine-protein kinase
MADRTETRRSAETPPPPDIADVRDEADDSPPDEVIAEDGRVWRTGRELGRGGQGNVYSLDEGPLVVKLARGDSTRAELQERLASVRRLPLEELPIARPIVQLREPDDGSDIGYVMRLIDDVAPLTELSEPPRGMDRTHWYAQTGGMRRRLLVLARLADVLNRLHAQSIVYCDLSLANVLISSSPDHHETWLIDPDNLRYTSVAGRRVYTKPFAAPEVLEHSGMQTTLTDAHALAVVIYKVLTGAHPLLNGALVQADAELIEPALHGRLPWIDDPVRRENARMGGPAPELVLSRRLFSLARETFEAGLLDPAKRARASAWAAELAWAADLCVTCPQCEQSYLASGTDACVWCKSLRPRLALASIGVCNEQGGVHLSKRSPHVLAVEGEQLRLTRRHVFGERAFTSQHELAATLLLTGARVLFEPAVDGAALAERGRVRTLSPGERVELPATSDGADNWAIHFGEPETLHRLARLQVIPERRP